MRSKIIPVLFLLVLAQPASAEKRVAADLSIAANAGCHMQEDGQVSVNFNSNETDLRQIDAVMDKKVAEVEALAKEAGIDKFEIQNMNYNVYANSAGGCGAPMPSSYQFNGSITFTVTPTDKAADFLAVLTEKGYMGSLNVNIYRQCQ